MGPPVRLPTAERRLQIAEAVLRIMSAPGGRPFTVAALAEEVGVAEGTLFRHFKTKAEIVDAAIDLLAAALETSFPPEVPAGAEGGPAPLERLGMFVVQRLTLVRQRPEFLRLAFNDRLADAAGPEGAARIESIIGRSVHFIRDCMTEAQERGDVDADVPVMILVWMVIGVIRGASMPTTQPGTPPDELHVTSPEDLWAEFERYLRGGPRGRRHAS